MPVQIAVVAEADADRRHITELIDRKLCHDGAVGDDGPELEQLRTYRGLEPDTTWTSWRDLARLPIVRGSLQPKLTRGGEAMRSPGFDFVSARKVLSRCALSTPPIDAVVLVRDLDAQREARIASLEAARQIVEAPLQVVLALPDPKREAWVLAGWTPNAAKDEARLATERKRLGFDPCAAPERLRATGMDDDRSAKRILAALLEPGSDREASCWRETAWETLHRRGQRCGLAAFLAEVEAILMPLMAQRHT